MSFVFIVVLRTLKRLTSKNVAAVKGLNKVKQNIGGAHTFVAPRESLDVLSPLTHFRSLLVHSPVHSLSTHSVGNHSSYVNLSFKNFNSFIHITHRIQWVFSVCNTQYKRSCTQMFILCGNRTCDFLRNW
jgi:hypothetical protein